MSKVQPQGYAVKDTSKWTQFEKINFELKTAEDTDVDIDILACGVCGSDVHTISVSDMRFLLRRYRQALTNCNREDGVMS